MEDYLILTIIMVLLFPIELYLSLRKNIVVAAIIPIISFIVTFRLLIDLLKGNYHAATIFPGLASTIIIIVFISCRIVVRHKHFTKTSNKTKLCFACIIFALFIISLSTYAIDRNRAYKLQKPIFALGGGPRGTFVSGQTFLQ